MKDVVVKQERDWDAEWDAQTLARALEIQSDKERLGKAQKAAVAVVEEKEKNIKEQQGSVEQMKKIAKNQTRPSEKVITTPVKPMVQQSGRANNTGLYNDFPTQVTNPTTQRGRRG